jgi:hypothetical protein
MSNVSKLDLSEASHLAPLWYIIYYNIIIWSYLQQLFTCLISQSTRNQGAAVTC